MGYQLVVKHALQNEYLEAVDRSVLKELVYALDLQGDPTLVDINTKWVMQQRMEANMIYLSVKYEKLQAKQEGNVPEVEAACYLNLPDKREDGKKYTLDDKKQLVKVEPDLAVAKHRQRELKDLVNLLGKLSRTVFGRNQKLDHLGVNYRREILSDTNAQ
jgi:hypothetical protein